MKTSAVLAVSFIGILLTLPAQSEEQEFLWGHPPLLATTSTIKVEVWDGVEGGCFTNKAGIKDAVELAFRRNGLKVTEEDLSDVFAINIYGRRALAADGTKLGCTVSSSANLYMRRLVTVPYSDGKQTVTIVTHFVAGRLNAGPEAQNDVIKDFAITAAEKLTNEILKCRDDVFSQYPSIKASFEAAQ